MQAVSSFRWRCRSPRHCSPYTCVRASKILFCQLLSTTSSAAGLGAAVRTCRCSPHNCVRASKILFCQLLPTPSIAAGLGAAVLMRHCSPHNCVRASKTLFGQLLSTVSSAAGLGGLHSRLCSPHICVRTRKILFCLLLSTTSSSAGLGAAVTPTSRAAFAHGTGCKSLLRFRLATCVSVSIILFCQLLHYFEHCWPRRWRCRPHAPLLVVHLRACEQDFILPTALHYFERCRPWRCCLHVPLFAAHLRAFEHEFVCQLLSTPSIAAGLGAAVLMRHCSPHNCVRASKTLFYQLLSAASRAAGLGALHLRLCSQHICVRTRKNLF